MKITIIGAGNMGGAIALGLSKGTIVMPEDITVTAKTEKTLSKIVDKNSKIKVTTSNSEAVIGADIVFIAVKPWQLEDVVEEIKSFLDYSKCAVASIVAGVSFEKLAEMFDKGDSVVPVVYRIIPNTAISLGQSVTFIAEKGASEADCALFKKMFDELGETIFVNEKMMAAGTSLASCGIAFAFKYLDASICAGVSDGFSENEARKIVIQTMSGALELLKYNNTMPQTEIDRVTTPGGLTLKGLEAMSDAGFEKAVMNGVKKSR